MRASAAKRERTHRLGCSRVRLASYINVERGGGKGERGEGKSEGGEEKNMHT